MIRRRAVAELLVEVVGERYLVGLEIPLENYVIRHIGNGLVSVLAYYDLIDQIVERARQLTVLVVAYSADTSLVITAADLLQSILDLVKRLRYLVGSNDRAYYAQHRDQYRSAYDKRHGA